MFLKVLLLMLIDRLHSLFFNTLGAPITDASLKFFTTVVAA